MQRKVPIGTLGHSKTRAAKSALGHSKIVELPDAGALDWDDFRVFTATARAGSYTRAARLLGLGQPAVSRRIARLERAIGARLFDRGTSGIELTSEGAKLLNFASGAEVMLARGISGVRSASQRLDSDCKLSIGDGLGTYWLPPFLASFLENNPHVGLTVFTAQETSSTAASAFDLQIHYAHPISVDSVATRLGTLHFNLYAAPEYVVRYGIPTQAKELKSHRILDFSFRLTDKSSLASWAGFDQDATLVTNSSAVLAETVRSGGGIGLLPTFASVIDPELVLVMPELHYHAPIFVCFEREAAAKPAVRATIDFLKDIAFDMRNMPWFSEEYVRPCREWEVQYENCLARAGISDIMK